MLVLLARSAIVRSRGFAKCTVGAPRLIVDTEQEEALSGGYRRTQPRCSNRSGCSRSRDVLVRMRGVAHKLGICDGLIAVVGHRLRTRVRNRLCRRRVPLRTERIENRASIAEVRFKVRENSGAGRFDGGRVRARGRARAGTSLRATSSELASTANPLPLLSPSPSQSPLPSPSTLPVHRVRVRVRVRVEDAHASNGPSVPR